MVMPPNPDPSQLPFVLLVNQSREKQGLNTVDVAKPAYVMLPSYDEKNPAAFDAACHLGMAVNTSSDDFTPEAVESKVAEMYALGKGKVSVDVFQPGKVSTIGGTYQIADFNAPGDNYTDTVRDLVEQARRLKNDAAAPSVSPAKNTPTR